jgi:hypothetical protein
MAWPQRLKDEEDGTAEAIGSLFVFGLGGKSDPTPSTHILFPKKYN